METPDIAWAATRTRKAALGRWVSFAIFLAALAGLDGRLSRLYAQNQDVAAQFPEPAQVTVDYPDDVERWGAFNVLRQALYNLAPKPMSKAAYEKAFAYEAAYNGIANTFIAKGGAQNQAYKDFNARCDKLFSNADFGRSVQEKYHLTPLVQRHRDAVAAATAAAATQSSPGVAPRPVARHGFQPPEQRNFLNDPWPYPQSFPLLLFFLLPVAFFTWLALTGRRPGAEDSSDASARTGGAYRPCPNHCAW